MASPAALRLPGRFRFRAGTLLLLVAAFAPALASYTVASNEPGGGSVMITIVLLLLVFVGVLIGVARRATPNQVIAQVGLAFVALLSWIRFSGTELGPYWLLAFFATTVVLPATVRCMSNWGCLPTRCWHELVSAVLVDVAFNILISLFTIVLLGYAFSIYFKKP
jgi:hypothetical protein